MTSADDGRCADASLNARPAGFDLLGVAVSAVNLSEAVARIEPLARTREAGGAAYVCVRDVNGIIECQRDEDLRQIHRDAALVTPDGMPVVWWGRLCGYRSVDRVYGPDLMTALCARSAASGLRHFLYGGPPGCVEELAAALVERFPGLCLVGSFTPPFRPLSAAERIEVVNCINRSGADVVWVGLSSPKQERFMADIAPALTGGVLIGVGAAFDFLSGRKPQAPRWLQRSGFEWAFRLATEPRRLWRRYLLNNSRFLWLVICELAGFHRSPAASMQPTQQIASGRGGSRCAAIVRPPPTAAPPAKHGMM